nr:endonuclease domain-containing protein [Sphingomonas abaci]
MQGSPAAKTQARQLRQSMSLSEILLWRILRQRPNGLKFRRQHPAGLYAADFYCHEARLIVDIDGEAQDRGDRPERDAERDAWFRARGIATLRVPATVMLKTPDDVLTAILHATELPQ